jgi:putative selenate reductase
VDDLCNECGNCATFCVHDGKPYLDKPRLFLAQSDFEQESDNAFYVERCDGGWIIRRREGGQESRLAWDDGKEVCFEFENELLRIGADADFQVQTMELKDEFEGDLSLAGMVEMAVILQGIVETLPFLPIVRR